MKKFSKNLIKKFSEGVKAKSASFPFERLGPQLFSFLSRHFKLIMTGLLALALADLFILFLLPVFLPKEEQKAPSAKIRRLQKSSFPKSPAAGGFVSSKNIFHRGDLPSSLSAKKDEQIALSGEESKLSSLPFKLLGTIVNENSKRSMASIFNRSDKKATSYFVGDTIDNKAEIQSIQRRKVIFINLLSDQLEHIEIPLEKDSFALNKNDKPPSSLTSFLPQFPKKKQKKTPYEGITEVKENEFSLNRSLINDHLQKLPDILQQASLKPKIDKNGQAAGHTFTWIKQGSVYEGMGFEKGDTLVSINGEKVNNVMEATELFHKSRSTSQFLVVVENKNGQKREVSYNINEDASAR